MMRSLKDLEGYRASATDGDVGAVDNFLLDDESWIVRYLVVAAGGPLGGRRVLISPTSFRQIDWPNRRFHLALTIDSAARSLPICNLGARRASPSIPTVTLDARGRRARLPRGPCAV